jgi:hypothetical protein
MTKKQSLIIQDEILVNKIHFIRGQKIMIDRDLAELYEVETKRLKEAVKRNIKRFPSDFMFEMTLEEFENWRSQFASSNSDKMGLRYRPFCFTEQGVTMLSSVLNSKRAIEVNIRIVRLFIRLREVVSSNKEILRKLEQLESRLGKHDEDIEEMFSTIRELVSFETEPRKAVGYKWKKEN